MEMSDHRMEKAEQAVWGEIIGNCALALLKGSVGWFGGSKGLLADAVHSAADAAGSFAALVGLRSSRQMAEEERSGSRGNAESVAAVFVSVLLLLVGFELGMSALKAIYKGVDGPPATIALYAIPLSLLVKEAMFRTRYRAGRKSSNAPSLLANDWVHRSDVYASVVALVGVGGAVLGGVIGMPQLYYLDPIAGVFISVLVLRMGCKLVLEAIHSTMDRVLHQEDAEELVLAVQRIKGVIAVDDLRAREHGHYVVVDVKISVNPRITVMEGNEIAKAVKAHLMRRFIHVSDVMIQVNPYDPGYPYKLSMDASAEEAPPLLH